MIDFSHMKRLPWRPEEVASRLDLGMLVPDRIAREAINQCVPPLLPPVKMVMLRRQFEFGTTKRGRPRLSQPTRRHLIEALKQLKRPDLPETFLPWLVRRLESGRSVLDAQSTQMVDRHVHRHDRVGLIVAAYRRIYAALDGSARIQVDPIGWLDVPQTARSKSEQALEMTWQFLNGAGRRPPSKRTMHNIISKNRHRKRE